MLGWSEGERDAANVWKKGEHKNRGGGGWTEER